MTQQNSGMFRGRPNVPPQNRIPAKPVGVSGPRLAVPSTTTRPGQKKAGFIPPRMQGSGLKMAPRTEPRVPVNDFGGVETVPKYTPRAIGQEIDDCVARVGMLRSRMRFELVQILVKVYGLLLHVKQYPSEKAVFETEMCERGSNPAAGVEHALMNAILNPQGREEQKKADKYARALIALDTQSASVAEAQLLLKAPGIDALAASIATKRQPGAEGGEAGSQAQVEDPAALHPVAAIFTHALMSELTQKPAIWVTARVLLNGPGGKPLVRAAADKTK